MDHGRVVLVALLLCLAPLGGVTAVGEEHDQRGLSVVSADGTAEYLAPAPVSVDRTGQDTASMDVAAVVDSDAVAARVTFDRYAHQRAYRNADSEDERDEIVANATRQHVEGVTGLEQRYSRTLERYRDGDIDESRLLRELAILDDEVEATAEITEWLLEIAGDRGLDEEHRRLMAVQHRLLVLEGPVRERVSRAAAGESDVDQANRVHVETSGEGLVLATVDRSGDDPVYVREAANPTAFTVDVADQYHGLPEPVFRRYGELYPWADNNSLPNMGSSGHDEIRVYRFRASHPHGELVTYLDAGSEEILYETQYKDPERVPTTTNVAANGSLRLVVEATHAGGPLGVSVVDPTREDPTDATVAVNGDPVGRVGDDQLWTVGPRGETTVNATRDGETVSVVIHLE